MIDNIELCSKILNELSIDHVMIANISSNKNAADILVGNSERSLRVGDLSINNNIIFFNVGPETYRVINMINGFQVFVNYINYFMSYTSLPDFMEVKYIDKNCVINMVKTKKENAQVIDIKSMFFEDLKHERNFQLEIDNNAVYYNYYEAYHTETNSSNPVWYYTVDTKNNKFTNYGQKGENNFGMPLNLEINEAKNRIVKQVNTSLVLNDINKVKELSKLNFLIDINNTIGCLNSSKRI